MTMTYWAAPGQFEINTFKKIAAVDSREYFDPERVKAVILSYFALSENAILRKDRTEHLVYTRFFLHYFLNVHSTLSKKEIGRRMKQDHTSVINGVRAIKDQLSLRANNKYKEDHYRIYLLLTAPTLGNGQTH